jgi:hypothetical protein
LPVNHGQPWDKIRQEYVTTPATLTDLSRKYKVARSWVSKHAKDGEWNKARAEFQTQTDLASHTRILAAAVDSRVRLYDSTRIIADRVIAMLLDATSDPMTLRRHAIQREERNSDGAMTKWVEDKILDCINGKNLADISKAMKDLAYITRQLDGVIDAPDQAKLDIEREKLELTQKQLGLDDDTKHESGIAYMPGIDDSILDTALPDPDQTEQGRPEDPK